MRKITDFETEEQREDVIKMEVAQGTLLIEEQSHFDGKHLVFEIPDRDLAAEIDDLAKRLKLVEDKVKEMS